MENQNMLPCSWACVINMKTYFGISDSQSPGNSLHSLRCYLPPELSLSSARLGEKKKLLRWYTQYLHVFRTDLCNCFLWCSWLFYTGNIGCHYSYKKLSLWEIELLIKGHHLVTSRLKLELRIKTVIIYFSKPSSH